jgi:hypothetical protein
MSPYLKATLIPVLTVSAAAGFLHMLIIITLTEFLHTYRQYFFPRR